MKRAPSCGEPHMISAACSANLAACTQRHASSVPPLSAPMAASGGAAPSATTGAATLSSSTKASAARTSCAEGPDELQNLSTRCGDATPRVDNHS
eukprot:scaffold302642_cov28-Tisochrysis_lutea.AAC.3